MPTPLANLSIEAPGSFGLNKQRTDLQDPRWATEAKNIVFSDSGRIAAREGWEQITTTPISGTPDVEQIHPFLKADGTLEVISAAGNKIYSGTTTLTELTGGGFTTPTDNNWEMVNFIDKLYAFQIGHTPFNYDGTTIADLTDGNAPAADTVLSSFGRIWAANTTTNKTTVWYSDLLDGTNWTTGTSGLVDLDLYLAGTDSVVALADFNGYLVVFCRDTIMVFEGADDPNAATFGLVETIRGVGCIARDSVQVIGTDILFLSSNGVVSLGRVIQEKSMPFNDVSFNVRDYLRTYSSVEDETLIRSTYHPVKGFYLLTFPTFGITFCFDVRSPMEDGTYRVSYWDSISPKAMSYIQINNANAELYLGQAGVVANYTGYTDDGSTYFLSYRSPWLDFGDSSRTKLLKRLRATLTGGYSYSVVFKYSFDYSDSEKSITASQIGSGVAAEFGIAEYGIAEYSGSISNTDTQVPLTNSGSVVKIGLESTISGSDLGIKRMTIYAKAGRII